MVSVRSVLRPLGLSSARSLAGATGIADSSLRRQVSRALITRHHQRLGGSRGPLGVRMGDVRLTSSGATMPFAGGSIELRHTDVGPSAIKRHRAEVRFLGFRCHAESGHDQLSPSDEPYFILSVVGTNQEGRVTRTFGPYRDVDSGEERFESEVLTTFAQPPFSVSAVGFEHDSGDPDEAAARVDRSLNDAADKIALGLTVLGANPAVGSLLQSIANIFGDVLGDVSTGLFGLDDDRIGEDHRVLNDWDAGAERWHPPPRIVDTPAFGSNEYNLKLNVGDSEEGKYTLYFNVHLFEVSEVVVPPEG